MGLGCLPERPALARPTAYRPAYHRPGPLGTLGVMLGQLWAGFDAGLSECWWGTKIGGFPINGRSISPMALIDDTTAGNHR